MNYFQRSPRFLPHPQWLSFTSALKHLAEIATGKLALDKSQDPKIDKFAQQMIDDHTKAPDDLKKVAQGKGVELPPEADFVHKRC